MTIAYVTDRSAIEAWDCAAMEISAQAACEYFHSTPSNVRVEYDSGTDGQVVLLRDPGSDTTVIAFRGTDSMTNWLTNVKFVSAKRDGMSIHAGFDDAAAALQPGILNYLQEHHGPTSTLMVTGHSRSIGHVDSARPALTRARDRSDRACLVRLAACGLRGLPYSLCLALPARRMARDETRRRRDQCAPFCASDRSLGARTWRDLL